MKFLLFIVSSFLVYVFALQFLNAETLLPKVIALYFAILISVIPITLIKKILKIR